MNANAIDKIRNVSGSKALPKEMAARVRAIVEELIATRFTRADGTVMAERTIAQAMGLSQPVLNAIRNEGKAIGVGTLLALREYTGRSIDDLLGLAPTPKFEGPPLVDRVTELERRLTELADVQVVAREASQKPRRR